MLSRQTQLVVSSVFTNKDIAAFVAVGCTVAIIALFVFAVAMFKK